MASIEYIQVRKGMVLVGDDGQLYSVVDKHLNTPGNWRAILNLKLKNLKTGAVTPKRFRPDDKVEQAYLDKRPMQYLYKDGDDYVFMDKETYDQVSLGREAVGDLILYLKENNSCQVTFYDGKPLSIDLPASVELTVTDTEPGVKGDTVSNVTKPATLETGAVVQVPLFVNVGDKLKVDPREGRYISRA